LRPNAGRRRRAGNVGWFDLHVIGIPSQISEHKAAMIAFYDLINLRDSRLKEDSVIP
jgi:prepilin-type processing-associated H-X9-DG protein